MGLGFFLFFLFVIFFVSYLLLLHFFILFKLSLKSRLEFFYPNIFVHQNEFA